MRRTIATFLFLNLVAAFAAGTGSAAPAGELVIAQAQQVPVIDEKEAKPAEETEAPTVQAPADEAAPDEKASKQPVDDAPVEKASGKTEEVKKDKPDSETKAGETPQKPSAAARPKDVPLPRVKPGRKRAEREEKEKSRKAIAAPKKAPALPKRKPAGTKKSVAKEAGNDTKPPKLPSRKPQEARKKGPEKKEPEKKELAKSAATDEKKPKDKASAASTSVAPGLPVRKPPKPRIRKVKEEKDRKRPDLSRMSRRERDKYLCKALQSCRNKFVRCKSKIKHPDQSKEWSDAKEVCGAHYKTCVQKDFQGGEWFFTRWFYFQELKCE